MNQLFEMQDDSNMTETTIFLLAGFPRAGKTAACAIITKLLRPFGGRYTAIGGDVNAVLNRIYGAAGSIPWVVDGWQTYEEAIALKGGTAGRLITIEIKRAGAEWAELPMGRTSHVIENNGTLQDLERQLAAMLRQYYPGVGLE
jgi:hypothetical protein